MPAIESGRGDRLPNTSISGINMHDGTLKELNVFKTLCRVTMLTTRGARLCIYDATTKKMKLFLKEEFSPGSFQLKNTVKER